MGDSAVIAKMFEDEEREDESPRGFSLYQEMLGITSEEWEQLGPQARRIITELIPAFVQRFVQKNLHYGPNNANVLGPAGQFADIWRKIGPLKRALWDGEDLTQESADEICRDLIGHAFLTIDMLEQKVERRGS